MDFNLNRSNSINLFFVVLLISTSYLAFFTKEHYFFSDDFYYIIGPKLYTLITGERLKLIEVLKNLGPQDHYAPLYYYYLQFMPANAKTYHLVTILFHSVATLLVFLIANEIFKQKKISLVASLLYFYNMSFHSWPIVWNAFNAHIINSVPGFFSLYLSIKYLKLKDDKNLFFLIFISFFSGISIFIYESGFLYLVLIFLFQMFIEGTMKRKIKVLASLSIPIIIYFAMTFSLSGKIHPIIDRYEDSTAKEFYKVTDVDPNSLYARRSNYAERNLINYSIRLSENFINSFNLGIIEFILKDHLNETAKKKIKQILID